MIVYTINVNYMNMFFLILHRKRTYICKNSKQYIEQAHLFLARIRACVHVCSRINMFVSLKHGYFPHTMYPTCDEDVSFINLLYYYMPV